MSQRDQADLRTKTQQLLQGPLKHARVAALAAVLVPLASVAATPASAQTATCASGGVCGVVFNDTNDNGIIDAGETGIDSAQVTVCQLCDGTDDSVGFTDINGLYSIFVPGGTYTVSVLIPPGTQPSPLNINNVGVSNGHGSSVATVLANGTETDFGFAPAGAQHALSVTITATCGCEYTVTASGSAAANAVVGIDISFNVVHNGTTYPVTKHIDTNTDANGNFSVSIPGNPLPADCVGTTTFSGGSASLTLNGTTETGFGVTVPANLICNAPPPGKTFDIGPSSMEGHLLIRPGDWISGGYSFKFASGNHLATSVTVSSTLTMPYKCSNGTTGSFVINIGTQTISVPANNTDWQPTGDANSVLSWAGAGQAPAACGVGNVMDNSKGAVFEATIQQNPDHGSLLNWRFKYRDPNAKGKGNVNCLDTTDPRRAKADVCGASWSQTITDP